jgi:large subunit ribosomal protein L17
MAVIEIVQEAYKPAEKKPAQKSSTKAAATPAPKEELSGEVVTDDEATSEGSEQTVAEAAEESLSAKFADLEFGDDVAVALEDGAAPSEEFTIKGNKDSGKYHTPESQWYDQTIAEVWFTTEEAAENAGFVKAG